ncbi:hypothetical protein GQ600_1202 [Phytophthora cactorum]|nr:hypothetical protein GQ600_1202 [Phytophthora cactorum]
MTSGETGRLEANTASCTVKLVSKTHTTAKLSWLAAYQLLGPVLPAELAGLAVREEARAHVALRKHVVRHDLQLLGDSSRCTTQNCIRRSRKKRLPQFKGKGRALASCACKPLHVYMNARTSTDGERFDGHRQEVMALTGSGQDQNTGNDARS